MIRLLDLPLELLINICQYLKAEDTARLAGVCTSLYYVSRNDILWRAYLRQDLGRIDIDSDYYQNYRLLAQYRYVYILKNGDHLVAHLSLALAIESLARICEKYLALYYEVRQELLNHDRELIHKLDDRVMRARNFKDLSIHLFGPEYSHVIKTYKRSVRPFINKNIKDDVFHVGSFKIQRCRVLSNMINIVI